MGGGVDLTSITQFELSGSTFGSKAVFTRGSKDLIHRMFATIKALDSLKSGETNGKKHTVRIIKVGGKEYHYNFQSSVGQGNMYHRILALTDLKTRKAIPMTYYFDVQARMHFKPAAGSVKTLLPRDKELAQQMKNWVFTFSEDVANNINKTELRFTKTDTLGADEEKGVLTTQAFSQIGYVHNAADSVLWARNVSKGLLFWGMEKNLKKDATNLNRLLMLFESPNFFSTFKPPPHSYLFSDPTRNQLGIPIVDGGFFQVFHLIFRHSFENLYFFRYFYVALHSSYMLPFANALGFNMAIGRGKIFRALQKTFPDDTSDLNNYLVFSILPVCLGFEWHQSTEDFMLAFYIR